MKCQVVPAVDVSLTVEVKGVNIPPEPGEEGVIVATADPGLSLRGGRPGYVTREELVTERETHGRYPEHPHDGQVGVVEPAREGAAQPRPQTIATPPVSAFSPTRDTGAVAEDFPAGLWVTAVLIFGFGDSLTSILAFSAGAREANPLIINLWKCSAVASGALS